MMYADIECRNLLPAAPPGGGVTGGAHAELRGLGAARTPLPGPPPPRHGPGRRESLAWARALGLVTGAQPERRLRRAAAAELAGRTCPEGRSSGCGCSPT
ncbi:hypothetical protein MRQ36_03855 [Micromonospora sp. R77]|uniref:hypothetical protein n=1 Tax=Micromonospora sp. R77 TaxID=2925836 RepID=UPI001F61B865|nr:hypothetical protein [Micromonospora sp. R77]MCI4061753.1 hypothetical protein [Micromonospora sp. R77]